jgi:hypothetical protein
MDLPHLFLERFSPQWLKEKVFVGVELRESLQSLLRPRREFADSRFPNAKFFRYRPCHADENSHLPAQAGAVIFEPLGLDN